MISPNFPAKKSLVALIAALGLTLSMSGVVIADPTPAARSAFEMGVQAYRKGDVAAAVLDWRKAAKGGHPMAAYLLGQLYEQGRGVAVSPATAFRYYKQAAAAGQAQAAVRVGLVYRDGNKALGVRSDYQKALKMFETGALASWPEAQFYLADMYRRGLGVPASQSESLRWLILAARKHHVPSLIELARVHYEGEGVPQDRVQGWSYIGLASRFADAEDRKLVSAAMNKYSQRMRSGEKERAKEVADEWLAKNGAS
jgi:TPR repeat protein